jgi:hypothetical protein
MITYGVKLGYSHLASGKKLVGLNIRLVPNTSRQRAGRALHSNAKTPAAPDFIELLQGPNITSNVS